ncbi:hypothetical protein D3C87_771870 [compost metagenome]
MLPIGTNLAASNICTSVSDPLAEHMTTDELSGWRDVIGALRRTSLPTVKTCSTSSAVPVQNCSAQAS